MVQRPMVAALGVLVAMLTLGTLGYMWIEGWSALDSLWMVVITLTTIGFGEVHPLSPAGRLYTIALVFAGVSAGTYAMTALTQHILEGRMALAFSNRRRRRMMDALHDHFIVVGFGRLGQTIVEELMAGGVPVCVIEKDPPAVARVQALGLPLVIGDGASDEVLREARIAVARGLAVAVSSSAEAVYVTLSARELHPTLNIVTRVADAGHAIKARRAGATSVVSPHTMGGWRMAHGLVRPHASSFLDLASLASHADILLDDVAVHAGSRAAGATLGALRLGEYHNVLIVAIRRPDGAMVATPHADERIAAGDVLIAIGAPGPVRAFRAMVQGGATPA